LTGSRSGRYTFSMSDPWKDYRQRKEYACRINRVIDYINQHLSEDLTLEGLSQVASFSPYHFHRLFHTMVGETLNAYITRLRLEKAAHKLRRNRNLSVTEIALECGFSSSSAFTRAFKLLFNEPPTEYRKRFVQTLPPPGTGDNLYGRSEPPLHVLFPDMAPSQYARFRNFPFTPRVEQLPGYHVAYIRLIGFTENTFNENISRAFDRLALWLRARDIFTPETLCIGVTYDDTEITEPGKCRYMACYTVPPGTRPEGEVGIEDIHSGKFVSVRIEGEWAEYGEHFRNTISYLYGLWFPGSGFEPGEGLSYLEKYYTPKSRGLSMDLCVPVKPA